ncbi:conserved hypothetical protein [Rippkaea orientalis PCC 8801]|uniref:Uncharacterized protein n=1 Tax=Rippkaea orientalis (strain PCC 8801 / RF-1) TaxID=41431 RepID=B7K3G5_RIPO1|nr:hypothetical protein [Rippkaea orientalis]ACK65307.1 conserved hypothetical protein [Rippkaea orientalis PCC 8801]
MTESRQQQYYQLIEELISCPNGQEPDVLEAKMDLVDENFIQTLMEIATVQAHQGNQDGAKFLIFIARELAKQLGLYPEMATKS